MNAFPWLTFWVAVIAVTNLLAFLGWHPNLIH